MQSNTHIILNVQAPNVAVVVNAKQGDKMSRIITANLVDGDIPFILPQGVEAVIRYFKPDKTIGFYDTTEDGEKAVVIDGSTITITLAEQALTVPGNVYAEVNFYTTTEKLTTFNFVIHVQKSAVSDEEIESTDYFSVLTQKINAILGAAVNPPYINPDNKNWMIWSETSGEYVDSGFSSIGLIPPSTVTYQAGTSGTTPPTGTWTETIPTVAQGGYLWTRTQFEFADGTNQTSYSVARQGMDGSGSVSAVFGVGPDASGNVNPAPFAGVVKSDGTFLLKAEPGEDYQTPLGFNPGMVNPNLLDNWYFGNPVNQRGQTSYSGVKYGIDRWKSNNGYQTVSIVDGGISISTSNSSTGYEVQILEDCVKNALLDKTVTLSMLCSDGVFLKATGKMPATTPSSQTVVAIAETTKGSIQLVLASGGTPRRSMSVQILSSPGQTIIPVAAKLELGDTQTLAHQDSSGNWVLNEIPDYGEQLARCQRYFNKGRIFLLKTSDVVTVPLTFHDYPVTMRTVPAITFGEVFVYHNGASAGVTASTNQNQNTENGIYSVILSAAPPVEAMYVDYEASADI